MLLANDHLNCLWWEAIGDDFHFTQANIASSQTGLQEIAKRHRESLLALLPELGSEMDADLVFKLNAGKNIGNYNLAKCRHVTDKADRLWLGAEGLSDLWEDTELEHSSIVRTSFDDE